MAETSATLLQRLNDRTDSVAWQRLVDLYTPLINAWLRRQGVSLADAEDLTQEVLGILVREVARFRHNRRAGRSGPGCERSRSTASASPGGHDAFELSQPVRRTSIRRSINWRTRPAN